MIELKMLSEQDLEQTIRFWSDWLNQKKSANVGEFMVYGGRALDACKELLNRRADGWQYEDIGSPDEFAELTKAKAEGRLVVLPCKVGDTVYELSPRRDKINLSIVPSLHTIVRWMEDGAFGTILFLTQEEAEVALREARG